ncbi:MAG: GTPase [Alphaproteobacteria bacterium]|nr:GTPase [Alphaproteobacteria bacterium]
MRLRTFSAPSMAEAMQQIRDALGDDAVIVSSHQSERGRGVQITAAAEPEAETETESDGLDDALFEPDAYPDDDVAAAADPLEDDILLQALLYHDVPETLARRLAAAGAKADAEDLVETLAIALYRYFEFRPLVETNRPLMLIGPPGAGKTVTLAKLSTAAALRGTPATMVTTDSVRAGASAQLSGYTNILQQSLLSADSPEALHAAILNSRGEHLLIDTPGTNPFNANEMADLKRFIAAADADTILVLPAGINAQDAAEMAAVFSRLGCHTMIATQLDTARRLGAILAAAQGGNLALSMVSISPSIAQGLTALNPMSLARVLLRDPEQSQEYQTSGAGRA